MSAGGEVRSQSSRLRLPGGERPPTFHVAAKILLSRHNSRKSSSRSRTRTADPFIESLDGVSQHLNDELSSPVVQGDGGLGGVEVDLAAPRTLMAPPRRPN
jgi:hypothetical protein